MPEMGSVVSPQWQRDRPPTVSTAASRAPRRPSSNHSGSVMDSPHGGHGQLDQSQEVTWSPASRDPPSPGALRRTNGLWQHRGPPRGRSRHVRLIDRDASLSQSNGKWNIKHDWGERRTCPCVCAAADRLKARMQNARKALYFEDCFHSVVNQSTWKIAVWVLASYTLAFTFFAVPYWAVGRTGACDMKNPVETGGGGPSLANQSQSPPLAPHLKEDDLTFMDAFFFSVETMATIGYGPPNNDIFFNGCPLMAAIITAETCAALLMNAVLLGILLNRVARGSPRAKTILFSDRAVMRKIRGRYHFMCQVCEVRKHALVEAHVRCYVIRRDCDYLATETQAAFQTFAMRTSHPNDELGGMLMMNLPSVVVHDLDAWSPLVPRPYELELLRRQQEHEQEQAAAAVATAHSNLEAALLSDNASAAQQMTQQPQGLQGSPAAAGAASPPHQPYAQWRFPDPVQRQVDCDQGSRDCVTCQTCGESYASSYQLALHCRFCATDGAMSGWDPTLSCATCGESFASHAALACHCQYENQLNPQNPTHVPAQAPSPAGTGGRSGKSAVPQFGGAGGLASSASVATTAAAGEKTGSDEPAQWQDEAAALEARRHHPLSPEQEQAASLYGAVGKNGEGRREVVEAWLRDTNAEVIVLVEGIDSTTSYTVQARHSYAWDEIEWDHTFAQCVFASDAPGGGARIDFTQFHDLIPVPPVGGGGGSGDTDLNACSPPSDVQRRFPTAMRASDRGGATSRGSGSSELPSAVSPLMAVGEVGSLQFRGSNKAHA